MQKCGQLQASIAVALIAQSAAGAVCPVDTPSAAITASNKALCITLTPLLGEIIRLRPVLRKTFA